MDRDGFFITSSAIPLNFGSKRSHINQQTGRVKTASLQSINFNGYGMGNDRALAYAKALQIKTALKTTTFNFSGNGLTETGASALIQAVSDIGTVTDLDLSNNRIGRLGTESLVKYLKTKGKDTLRKLSLKGNRLGDKWAKLVLSAAEKCSALDEINLADNSMRSARALSSLLCSGSNDIQRVDISWNGLRGHRVVADLMEGLTSGNCHIKELILAYNGFGVGDRSSSRYHYYRSIIINNFY